MPSCSRCIFVAVHTAAFTAILGSSFAVTSVFASPMAMPLPLISAEHSGYTRIAARQSPAKSMRIKHTVSHNHTQAAYVSPPARSITVATKKPSNSSVKQRDTTSILDNINILNNYYNGANTHANNLKNLAAQSHTAGNNDPQFQQQAATEATGFQQNLLGFQNVLAELGGDKGLANYDRSNNVETLLKNVVNANKNALSATTALVYNIPGLGPILGPIVYEIKCLLDEVLDLTENLTDGTLNAIAPLLSPVISQASTTACQCGIEIAGICL